MFVCVVAYIIETAVGYANAEVNQLKIGSRPNKSISPLQMPHFFLVANI